MSPRGHQRAPVPRSPAKLLGAGEDRPGCCLGRSPCFLHPTWHRHSPRCLGPAGHSPVQVLMGEYEAIGGRGEQLPRSPWRWDGGATGTGREGVQSRPRGAAPEALAGAVLGQLLGGRTPHPPPPPVTCTARHSAGPGSPTHCSPSPRRPRPSPPPAPPHLLQPALLSPSP